MKEHYQGLGHVAVYTRDMGQSIAFYETIGGSVLRGAAFPPRPGRNSWLWWIWAA